MGNYRVPTVLSRLINNLEAIMSREYNQYIVPQVADVQNIQLVSLAGMMTFQAFIAKTFINTGMHLAIEFSTVHIFISF